MSGRDESVYALRQAQQARHARYREAAQRLYPGAKVDEWSAVNESAEYPEGAFIEIVVFVPRGEIE